MKKYMTARKTDIKDFGYDIGRLDVKKVTEKTSGFVSRNSGRLSNLLKFLWHEACKIGQGFKKIFIDVKESI